MAPELDRIDHIHVFVADRSAAETWYGRVMGLQRLKSLEFWAPDGGPLTLANASGTVHLALFERPAAACRSTIAMGTSAEGLLAWRRHLADELGRPVEFVDHRASWSLYIEDPDGNPFEVTTYEHETLAAAMTDATEPPEAPGPASTGSRAPRLSFRPAQPGDALALHVLATQVFLDTYATDGIRPAIAREAESRYSTAVFLELLDRPDCRIVVAERSGSRLVAFAQLSMGTGHALVPESAAAELVRLYVQAPFLRRGVGRALLAEAEGLARGAGLATLWLTAWAGNTRALAFYRSQDYRELGETIYEFEGERFENRLFARSLSP